MSLSMYEVAIVPMIKYLKITQKLLEKAKQKGPVTEEKIPTLQLIEDMKDLTYQIQRISDSSKGVATRVGKAEPVALADEEKTYPELLERLQKTITILEGIKPESMVGVDDEVVMKTGAGELKFAAKSYLLDFAIPNFYFHVVMVYALLRKEGVDVGKQDFLGMR